MKPFKSFITVGLVFLGLLGCTTVPEPEISYDPAALKFNGEQAFVSETEFVIQFPNRDSGQPNNRLAAEWLQAQFTDLDLVCTMQEWEVVNFSQPLPLNNVVRTLAGELDSVINHEQLADSLVSIIRFSDNPEGRRQALAKLKKLGLVESL